MDFRASLRNARQMSVERKESVGCCGYVVMAGAICTVVIMVLLGIAIAGVGIAKLVMGGIYFHDCELDPRLPIWLIVDACVAIVLGCKCKCQCGDSSAGSDEEGEGLVAKIIKGIVGIFQFSWLVCGTIWVISVRDEIYSPDHCMDVIDSTTTPGSVNGSIILSAITSTASPACITCAEALVDFVFGIIIFQWSLMGLVVFTLLCVCVGSLCATMAAK